MSVKIEWDFQKNKSNQEKHGLSFEDAYAVLGVTASATDVEVKRAYRRLMSQHHPDKLVSQGLPKEMLELAKRKTQDIQAAYELINQHRPR